jgi:hypothetical protein
MLIVDASGGLAIDDVLRELKRPAGRCMLRLPITAD